MIPVLRPDHIEKILQTKKNPFWDQYFAFYSSWYGGICKDPAYLMLPLDDHMVHRGDGVFEALKTCNRKVFLFEPHLERMQRSADKIGLKLRFSIPEMKEIILQTLKVADRTDALIRLFFIKGSRKFSTNPYDPPESQFYAVITELKNMAPEKYTQGVKIGRSAIPVKEGWMSQVKSCNYLPNVMMKKESVDRKLDFTISFDAKNFIAESSTENIVIVDKQGVLTHPPLEHILKGTTMVRTFELAKENGIPVAMRNFTEKDLLEAKEVMMIGTTLDVLPVTEYENQKIGGGKAGEISKKLLALLQNDMNKKTADY